jgi:hypothetical protein
MSVSTGFFVAALSLCALVAAASLGPVQAQQSPPTSDQEAADADPAEAQGTEIPPRIMQALLRLPPTVAQGVAKDLRQGGCGASIRRLDEIVYQISLSGPRTQDYVVWWRNAFRCGYCGATGYCGLDVYLNPTPGRWVKAGLEGAYGWYTVRRRGRMLLVMKQRCHSPSDTWECATLYRASGDSLLIIDEARACLRSSTRQQKWPAKQPKHEGHCAATAYYDYGHCRQQCGEPFTSKRR